MSITSGAGSSHGETASADLESFNARMAELNLQGQWVGEGNLEKAIGGPRPGGVPYRWRADVVMQALEDATEALGPVDTARRHLGYVNPGIPGPGPLTTHTMSAGIQLVKPGEIAWSHRHSISALRFVTKGHPDAFTAVDGEKLIMEDNDLLLTPRFSWHDHHNQGDSDVLWLDALDLGLSVALNQVFYEPYGEDSQNLRRDGDSIGLRSHWLQPTWENGRRERLPIRYPWREVAARLDRYDLDAGTPYDGLALRYANPVTGGPTLQTIDCWVQRLSPGFSGRPHRRSSSSIVHVISGHGTLEAGAETLDFGPGDGIALPNWTEFRWVNDSDSDPVLLFSIHDTPVLEALGLLYEEPEPILGASKVPANPTPSLRRVYRDGAFYDSAER